MEARGGCRGEPLAAAWRVPRPGARAARATVYTRGCGAVRIRKRHRCDGRRLVAEGRSVSAVWRALLEGLSDADLDELAALLAPRLAERLEVAQPHTPAR